MSHDYVDCRFERDGDVGILTLARPERMNALSPGIREGLIQASQEAEVDDGIKALVITGAGRGFCAGADAKESFAGFVAAEGRKGIKGPLGMPVAHIRRVEKPVITAVNGIAADAGLGIALACDVRIAGESARFSSIFVKRGLAAEWGVSYFLPRIVGTSKALRLMWSGDIIDAGEALRLGIADQVVPDADLMSEALAYAHKLADGPSVAIELIKRLVYGGLQNALAAHLGWEGQAAEVCLRTQDFGEGVQSFREKRPAQFKGL